MLTYSLLGRDDLQRNDEYSETDSEKKSFPRDSWGGKFSGAQLPTMLSEMNRHSFCVIGQQRKSIK